MVFDPSAFHMEGVQCEISTRSLLKDGLIVRMRVDEEQYTPPFLAQEATIGPQFAGSISRHDALDDHKSEF